LPPENILTIETIVLRGFKTAGVVFALLFILVLAGKMCWWVMTVIHALILTLF
jgi:hypothetical protein